MSDFVQRILDILNESWSMSRGQTLSSIIAIVLLTVGMSVCLFAVGMHSVILDYGNVLPKQLVQLGSTERESSGRGVMLSNALKLRELDEPEFRSMVLLRNQAFNVVLDAQANGKQQRRNAAGLWVDGDLFATVNWRVQSGRGFEPADFASSTEQPTAAIIGHRFWQSLGSESSIIGSELRVDGRTVRVIGVLPPKRLFFDREFYLAHRFGLDAELMNRNVGVLALVEGRRVKELNSQLEKFSDENPGAKLSDGKIPKIRIIEFKEFLGEDGATILWVVGLTAIALLLVSSLNAGSLMLAQWLPRINELATRAALGSTNARLLAVIIAHASIRVLIALVLALLLGMLATPSLSTILVASGNVPEFSDWKLTPPMMVWLSISVLVSVLAVSMPMVWKLRSSKLLGELRGSGRGNQSANTLGTTLLFLQTAFSSIVVFVSLMSWQGARIAFEREYGTDTQNLVVASLRGTDKQLQANAATAFKQALRSDPRIAQVSLATTIPQVSWNGRDLITPAGEVAANYAEVDPEFFTLYKLELSHGRWFNETDKQNKIVIDETTAELVFGKTKVVGKRLSYLEPNNVDTQYVRIIGVIKPVSIDMEQGPDKPSIFKPLDLKTQSALHVAIRPKMAALDFVPEVNSIFEKADANLALFDVNTYQNRFEKSASGFGVLFGIFAPMGLLASLLAGIGLAALLATLISQRLRESAIRKSLGASGIQLLVPLLKSLSLAALLGAVTGLSLFGPIADSLDQQIYSGNLVGPSWDFVFLILLSMLLVFACLAIAAIYPSYRALAVEPNVLLKER